jgi:predicted DNA-binding transcriptional regulator AlpA
MPPASRHPGTGELCEQRRAQNVEPKTGKDVMSTPILSEAEREYAVRLAREVPAVIDLDDLPRWIGMSRATIYRLRQRNRFPIRPIYPTTRRVQFAGIDVLRYLLRNKE